MQMIRSLNGKTILFFIQVFVQSIFVSLFDNSQDDIIEIFLNVY